MPPTSLARSSRKTEFGRLVPRAAPETNEASSDWEEWSPEGANVEGQIYEVSLPKPIGVLIGRGNDGRCYVQKVDPARGSVDPRIQPGDKLLRVSQSFGEETWEALNYGQVSEHRAAKRIAGPPTPPHPILLFVFTLNKNTCRLPTPSGPGTATFSSSFSR